MIRQRGVLKAVFLIWLLLPLTLVAQTLLFTADQSIQELYFNPEGRLFTLSAEQVCQYEDFQQVEDCVFLEDRGRQVIGISDRSFAVLSENEILCYFDGELAHRDSFPDLIFKVVSVFDKFYIATASGLFSYDFVNGERQLIGFAGQYVNDVAVYGDQVVVALDESIVAVDSVGVELWKNQNYNLATKLVETPIGVAFVSVSQELVFLDEIGQQIQSWSTPSGKIEQLTSTTDQTFIRTAEGVFVLKKEAAFEQLVTGKFEYMLLLDQRLLLVQGAEVLEVDLTVRVIPLKEAAFSVFSDSAASYWVGHNQRVTHYVNGELQQTIRLPVREQNVYVSAVSVSDDYIFAGTMGQGLLIFDRSGKFVRQVLDQEANNQSNIIQLKILNGFLWVAYLNGVIRIDLETLQIRDNYDNLLGKNYLYCVEPLGDNRFYIGTSNEGVLYYDEGKVSAFLAGESIYCLSAYDGKLYVGTEKSGIYVVEDTLATFLHPAKQVYALHALPSQLVVNDKESAYVLNLESLKVHPLGSMQLEKAQLNGSSENDQQVTLAYQNGLLELTKSQLSKLSTVSISLNLPKQFNEVIDEVNPSFSYDQNTITFSYHLNTSYQNKNAVFKYRLIGQDSSWRATQQNQVDFYQLPPGEYVFELDFGYRSDFTPSNVASYRFTVLPPFWLRWEFLLAASILVIGVCAYLISAREKRIKRKQERDKAQLEFEIHQLKQQVDPHFLFNSMSTLASLVEENPDQGVKALEKLSMLYRRILACQEKELIELSEEIGLVQDYFSIQQLRYETGIQLVVDVLPIPGLRVIPLSLQFLVENAIKHNVVSAAKPLLINIERKGDHLVITNNLNPKKQHALASGFGLKNLKLRYSYLSKLRFSAVQVDRKFIVHIPLIRD